MRCPRCGYVDPTVWAGLGEILPVLTRLGASSEATAVTYGALHRALSKKLRRVVSLRDFQVALDSVRLDGLIVVEEDPRDRRRKRIYQVRV